MYFVLDSNGKKLKALKSLQNAKKLADSVNGSVVYGGKVVYQPQQEEILQPQQEIPQQQIPQQEKETQQEIPQKVPSGEVKQKYQITTLINVRSKPSLSGKLLGTVKAGTVVFVVGIENDWLKVSNGDDAPYSYILYGNGEFARPLTEPVNK